MLHGSQSGRKGEFGHIPDAAAAEGIPFDGCVLEYV